MTDKIEEMTLETLEALPHDGLSPEVAVQLEVLRQLSQDPGLWRLVFFRLPADLALYSRHALLNEWRGKYDVQNVSIFAYTAELMEAIYKGNWITDMRHYQEPQVLLVEDFEFLVSKESTQESVYFNLLKPRLEAKKTTIIFSEYPLSELSTAFQDNLRNLLRLAYGNTGE